MAWAQACLCTYTHTHRRRKHVARKVTGQAAWITVGLTAGALDPCGHWVGLFNNTLFRDSEKKKAELKNTWDMKAERRLCVGGGGLHGKMGDREECH